MNFWIYLCVLKFSFLTLLRQIIFFHCQLFHKLFERERKKEERRGEEREKLICCSIQINLFKSKFEIFITLNGITYNLI